jgi:ribosome biogenesis GTPase
VSAKKKIRVEFQKNRRKPPRRQLQAADLSSDETLDKLANDERISGRGELTRARTIIGQTGADGDLIREINLVGCIAGRVLVSRGAGYVVALDDGRQMECTVRRVLKTMVTGHRSAVVAGDRVLVRPDTESQGVIERVESRRGMLSRKAKGRRHILVANVDQILIVGSAGDPHLKPSLIDRYLISASLGEIQPIIVINKVDLVDPVDLQPVVGLYSGLGYETVPVSTRTGQGLAWLKRLMTGRATALAGQSGVGKSSLINALEPGLNLATKVVAVESRKGTHTTSVSSLYPLSFGGWVVDTPGIRGLELWDVNREEVEGYFVEFHPFVRDCRFPDCSHRHESACGVKRALALGYISYSRYESYLKIYSDEPDA